MNKLLLRITSFCGWKRNLFIFITGAISSLAFAPTFMAVLLIPTFSILLAILEKQESSNKAFSLGWWFGFGHFTAGLYWISFALLVDGSQFVWLVPFAVFGIPSILSFYTAFICYLSFRFFKSGIKLWIGFSAIWVLFEILRSYLFTGFPWNLLGHSLAFSDELMQFASISGVFGLSIIVVLSATSLYLPISRKVLNNKTRIPALISILIMSSIWAFGYIRINEVSFEYANDVKIRIVQGGIAQSMKWEEQRSHEILQRHVDLTVSKGFNEITHVVWPESSIPYLITNDSVLFKSLARAVPKGGAIIAGAVRTEMNEYGFSENLWNSVQVINDEGRTASFYDKHHLVPFGEYIPFRNIIPFAVQKITAGSRDFSRGDGVKTLDVPGSMPGISALVCYEAIFSRHAVSDNYNRPGLLINVTNDAWYGNTSGPYQHFNIVRFRAVEQGIPLLRAANTGISGMIDSYGRVLSKTKLGDSTVLDVKLPSISPATLYSKVGLVAPLSILAIMLFFCIFRHKV